MSDNHAPRAFDPHSPDDYGIPFRERMAQRTAPQPVVTVDDLSRIRALLDAYEETWTYARSVYDRRAGDVSVHVGNRQFTSDRVTGLAVDAVLDHLEAELSVIAVDLKAFGIVVHTGARDR